MESTKITIIEDNVGIAKMLTKILNKVDNFKVSDVFNTAEEALESLNEFTSDVIISDLKLSTELNGLHAAEKIRELINTPIIFYSSTMNEDLILACLFIKNSFFVSKNTPIPELIEKIKMASQKKTITA